MMDTHLVRKLKINKEVKIDKLMKCFMLSNEEINN